MAGNRVGRVSMRVGVGMVVMGVMPVVGIALVGIMFMVVGV